MKKILSVLLSFCMLLGTLSVAGVAFADEEDVPVYTVGNVFAVVYDGSQTDSPVLYASFTPVNSAYYEFRTGSGLPANANGEITAYILNADSDEVVSDSSDATDREAMVVAAFLNAGQEYFFALEGENCGYYAANVLLNVHLHSMTVSTFPAISDTEYGITEDGSKKNCCDVCEYEELLETYPYAKISLSKSSFTYDGKSHKPTVTVKDRTGKVIPAANYTLTCKTRKNIGTTNVTVKFKGSKYEGTLKTTYQVKPKSTSLSTLTAKKSEIKVQWKKQATQTTGYELQYSTDKNFKKEVKTVKVTKNKTVSKTIKKLKKDKKYYFRIRTYKTVEKKKYYSSWSKVKNIKTKKK